MDPITGVALAGNVLQFAELGASLIAKTIEYSRNGGSKEHGSLQHVSHQLLVSTAHLQQALESEALSASSPGPGRALYLANQECRKVSEEFVALTQRLNLAKRGFSWSNVKLALEDLTKRKDLDILTKRVTHARSNLMLSLMVYTESKNKLLQHPMTEVNSKLLAEIQKSVWSNKEVSNTVQNLIERFDNFDIKNAALNDELVERTMQRSLEALLDKTSSLFAQRSKGLFESTCNQSEGYLQISGVVEEVLSSMDTELLFQRRILQSLYFDQMHHRRNRVSRAHSETYQWILRPKSSGSRKTLVWDDFHEWLCDRNRKDKIYWISGKPGSGKTTLMREIESQIDHLEDLQRLAESGDFVKVSFYFWWAGNAHERSLSGSRRTLAHQLLESRRELFYEVDFTPTRREAALNPSIPMPEWEDADLMNLLQQLIHLYGNSSQLLLLVDGLDELEGSDDDREHMIDFLKAVSKPQHVKLCVASRPWNIFRDAFRHEPQLRLEDLTKNDIKSYIRSTFQSDENFQLLAKSYPDLIRSLTEDICVRARGVFLWVRLVVRDLVRVVRDGAGQKELFRELQKTPTELDEYFERMIASIPKTYRKEAAMLLQTALCDMDYRSEGGKVAVTSDLLLLHLDWLHEDVDTDFVTQPDFQPMPFLDESPESQALLRRLERKLESRSMELLELDKPPDNLGSPRIIPPFTRVEFLHRTVKDFLLTADVQTTLRKYAGGNFDAHLFRCAVLIANCKSRTYASDTMKFDNILCCLKQLASRTDYSASACGLLKELWRSTRSMPFRGFSSRLKSIGEHELADWFLIRSQRQSCVHSLAVTLQWRPYLKSKLPARITSANAGRPLLDYALCRGSSDHAKNPDPWVVNELLRRDADPHALHRGSSLLARFVIRLQQIIEFDKEVCLDVLRNIIHFSPQSTLRSDGLVTACILFETPPLNIETEPAIHLGKLPSNHQLGDVLRALRAGTTEALLFSEFEIRPLERALQESLAEKRRIKPVSQKRRRRRSGSTSASTDSSDSDQSVPESRIRQKKVSHPRRRDRATKRRKA